MKYYESIICVSDLQIPFQHQDAFDFLYAIKKQFFINNKLSHVINMGDEVDQYWASRFVRSPDAMSGGMEHELCLTMIKDYWELFPVQDVCISNHTWRVFKLAMQAGIPKAFLRDVSEFLNAPKDVKWAQKWKYNNCIFEHGENVSGPNAAFNAASKNGMSTIIGHQHSWGGVKYIQNEQGILFGMNTGCLIDIEKYAFEYMRRSRYTPVLGCGVVLDNIAYFIPMELNDKKRWTGYISL